MKRYINKLRYFIVIALVASIAGGCIKEDQSDCGLNLIFKYDYNMAYTDKFPTDIFKLNVYVFDENGIFVGEFTDEKKNTNKNYKMNLPLEPGRYNIYTWAELRDDYSTATLVRSSAHFEEAGLSLIRPSDNYLTTKPKPLYHGAVTSLDVKRSGNKDVLVSLIKDTNFIRVTARGLPFGVEGLSDFSCRIEGDNAEYKFDNSVVDNGNVTYLTQSSMEDKSIISDFMVMRLLSTGQSQLVIEYKGREIFRKQLLPLVMTDPGIDLDRQDTYYIDIEFNQYTFMAVSITVNGWTYNLGGGIIG